MSTLSENKGKAATYGLLSALAILSIWAVSLTVLLSIPIAEVPFWQLVPAILWQAFIYTGLFITAHDAMHGSVFSRNLKVNHFIGAFAVSVYALFSYKKLLQKHWQHHRHPAQAGDPDFHDGRHKNPVFWYLHFMKGYTSLKQIVVLISVYYLIHWALGIPERNMFLFWILPSFLSSLQLFFFGTFLPHREPNGGYSNRHRAKTYPLPTWLSFLACYHFGFHEEHHEHPHIPWWYLPTVYRQGIYFGSDSTVQKPSSLTSSQTSQTPQTLPSC
ncbi:fatty acid desaturase [Pseudanabaena sp. FACHB-2040]|nr:fatty acid desaturase [Pseudanabaena sp. FACHB-2040]